MAHYAKVINNIVTEVIVAEQDFIDTLPDKTFWVQTSYNTRGGKHYDPTTGEVDTKPSLRKNYAGIGYKYDKDRDAFIPPQPFPSWKLNEDTCLWDPPVPYPEDNKEYEWDETTTSWKELSETLNR